MASEPLVVEFDDPIGATVRLPGLGGTIEGELVALELRASGDFWLCVRVQMWERWRTQLEVGQPSIEGIGPQVTRIWAPSAAVAIDPERGPEVAHILRKAEAAA